MRLIDANQIDFTITPIAPVLKGEKVHYETVAFAKQISGIPKVKAIPIEVLQEIRQKTYKLHPVKRGDNEYANGAYDGMCRVIDIVCDTIDAKIKEIANEADN